MAKSKEKKVKLADRMGGRTLEFRDGELIVKIKPLGNLLTYYLMDKCSEVSTSGQKMNVFSQIIYTVAYGIEEVKFEGKTWPMEVEKIFGKKVEHLRLEYIDEFTSKELNEISEGITEITNLTSEEKN